MLPPTNLEKVEPPPGMSYAENYTWDLALLLEGRTACYEKLPDWDGHGVHFYLSKFLAWACRHSQYVQTSMDNWISVTALVADSRMKMATPSTLFQAVFSTKNKDMSFQGHSM